MEEEAVLMGAGRRGWWEGEEPDVVASWEGEVGAVVVMG